MRWFGGEFAATRDANKDGETMKDTRRCSSQETGSARWKVWKSFQHGVALVSSWVEAWDLGGSGPRPGTPGSSFYTNLRYFVRYDSVPLGADAAQIAIYDALVARLGRPTARVDATAGASRAASGS
jgi:hypothetical protein